MKAYPFVAARMFGVPLLIHPTKGRVIAQALAGRLNITSVQYEGPQAATVRPQAGDWFDDDDKFSGEAEESGYDVVEGVAIVPVHGTLIHRGTSLRPYSGMLGYNAIATNYLTALQDSNVRAVVLDCNSPGGEVSGCFDLVDTIYAHRGAKPTWAILDDMAYSACYAIASACDKVIVPRTGGTGSVGVVTMLAEYSKALDGAGIKVHIYTHGARKAEGNPYQPVSKEAAAAIQADVDWLGDLFDETTARNRGMTVAEVRATQAATYLGAAGVDVGFADAVMAPDEAFRSLLAELG